ncbi:MAG: amidohydrolase, partial [Emcibacteraceae bacterium]|nr:amidohydrolase [Emcibacteraceae bacterium]
GFIDTHAHPVMGGAYAKRLSLDTFTGPDDWVKTIGEYADANKDQSVVFGYGFLASAFGEEGPTKEMIDSVVPDRPVFIMDEGFHSGWINTMAMDMLGINKDTVDPTPGFNFYKRDADGNPTGWLLEGTAMMAMEGLNVITVQSVTEGTDFVFDIMNSYGITAVFDAGADVENMSLNVLKSLDDNGQHTVRLVGSHWVTDTSHMEGVLDKLEEFKATTKTDKYHINTLKIMNDGTIEGRTAGMFEDYQGDPGNNGATVLTQEQLTELVVDAASRDLDIHIHALGERTIHESLNAIEASRTANPNSTTRYAICHIQVMTDEAVQRFADLDVIAQSTPLWASYDGFGKQFVSDDQFNRYFRFNSLKEAGVRMTFGSDFPASGAGTLGMSPIFNMEIGTTRQAPGEPDSQMQPPMEERLDVASLIRGYTIDAAYQLRMEDEIGSIKIGKKADLTILNNNPLEVDKYEIHKIEVDFTMMDGNVVYEK